MTDKLLPAGHYVIALAAVGGAFADGGWVSLRLAHAMVPEVIQRAAVSAIETFLPKDLEMLPAGAWWHVTITYQSAWDSGCMLGAQLQLPDALQSEQFPDALREFMPRATASHPSPWRIVSAWHHHMRSRPSGPRCSTEEAQMERATLSNMCLPPPVVEAIRDLCIVIAENVSIRDGYFRAGASRLAARIDAAIASGADINLSGDEIELAVDMAEAIVKAIVGGKRLVSSEVLTRICVRVVNPITDALGYVES